MKECRNPKKQWESASDKSSNAGEDVLLSTCNVVSNDH